MSAKLELRSWREFFRNFAFPQFDDISIRLRANTSYFEANYLASCLVIFLVTCYQQPWFILLELLLGGTAMYLFSLRKRPIVIGSRVISRKETWVGFISVVVVSSLLLGGVVAILCWALTAMFTCMHAIAHVETHRLEGTSFLESLNLGHRKQHAEDYHQPIEPQYAPSTGAANWGLDDFNMQQDSAMRRAQFRAQMRAQYIH